MRRCRMKIKNCPFCGKEPEINTDGTWIYIECCVSMSTQKSDHLTIEERNAWNNEKGAYPKDIEKKCLNEILKDWNRRS